MKLLNIVTFAMVSCLLIFQFLQKDAFGDLHSDFTSAESACMSGDQGACDRVNALKKQLDDLSVFNTDAVKGMYVSKVDTGKNETLSRCGLKNLADTMALAKAQDPISTENRCYRITDSGLLYILCKDKDKCLEKTP